MEKLHSVYPGEECWGSIWNHRNNRWIQPVVHCLGTSWRAASPLEWRQEQCPQGAGGGPTTCGMGGGSHTGIFPICIWTRLPYQTFPADPLRSQVSWMLGYGIEGDLCRFKTLNPFCTPGRAIMSIPSPCARKTPSQSRMQLPICLYFCFNYLLFHWLLWNKFMFLVLAT